MIDRALSNIPWESLIKQLTETKTYVAVGVLDGSGGEDPVSEGLTMAGLAAVHEFGATVDHPGGTPYKVIGGRAYFLKKASPEGQAAIYKGRVTAPHKIVIPARAPIRKTLDEAGPRINKAASVLLEQVVSGQLELHQALGQLGEFVTSQIRRTIQRGLEPPNAPGTIRRKKSSKPLIDEGMLIRSYTWQIREGEDDE